MGAGIGQLLQDPQTRAMLAMSAGLLSPTKGGSFGESLSQGLGAFNQTFNQAQNLDLAKQRVAQGAEQNRIAQERNTILGREPTRVRQLPSGAWVEERLDKDGNVVSEQFKAQPHKPSGLFDSFLGGGGPAGDGRPSPAALAEQARQLEEQRKGAPKPASNAPESPSRFVGVQPLPRQERPRESRILPPGDISGHLNKQEPAGKPPGLLDGVGKKASGLIDRGKADLNTKKAEQLLRQGDIPSLRALANDQNQLNQLPAGLVKKILELLDQSGGGLFR